MPHLALHLGAADEQEQAVRLNAVVSTFFMDLAKTRVWSVYGASYFVTVDIRPLQPDGDGMAFCRELPHRVGVVAIPTDSGT